MRTSYALLAILISSFTSQITSANDALSIPITSQPPLFDGRCEADEWKQAHKIQLPEQIGILLMHDQHSLYICAKGKSVDYTAFDLYVEDAANGDIYNLHASAQLSERKLEGKEWSETKFWNHQQWGGFWVPYAGEETTEKGSNTLFLEGSHREIQIRRNKFPGHRWRLMFRVSAVYQADTYGAEFYYPPGVKDKDPKGWATILLSE